MNTGTLILKKKKKEKTNKQEIALDGGVTSFNLEKRDNWNAGGALISA